MLTNDEKFMLLSGNPPVPLRPEAVRIPNGERREVPRYTLREAAFYLRIPDPTVRAWVLGRTFPLATSDAGYSAPLIQIADPDRQLLSFFNLVELHILRSTRDRDNVPMRAIRSAIDFVQAHFPSARPLITQEFQTDGRHLFVRQLGELINASKQGQLAMAEVLEGLLKRIDRDSLGLPFGFYPLIPGRPNSRAVAIRDGICSGAPTVAAAGVPVLALWERHRAGDTFAALAEDYQIPEEQVADAIAYLAAA